MPLAIKMGWTEKQLIEENSSDFMIELERELKRQETFNK